MRSSQHPSAGGMSSTKGWLTAEKNRKERFRHIEEKAQEYAVIMNNAGTDPAGIKKQMAAMEQYEYWTKRYEDEQEREKNSEANYWGRVRRIEENSREHALDFKHGDPEEPKKIKSGSSEKGGMSDDELLRLAERQAEIKTGHIGQAPTSATPKRKSTWDLEKAKEMAAKGKKVYDAGKFGYDAGKYGYDVFDTLKTLNGEEGKNRSATEAKFFEDNPDANPNKLTLAQKSALRRAVNDDLYENATSTGADLMSKIPLIGGELAPFAKKYMDIVSAPSKYARNAYAGQDENFGAALDLIGDRTGREGGYIMNPLGETGYENSGKGRPRSKVDQKGQKDIYDVWAGAYEFAVSDMEDEWYKQPYIWSTIDTSRLKSEAQMMEYFQRNNDHAYQVWLNRAQLENGDSPKGEWDNWYLKAKNEGLIGKQTPYAIEKLFAEDYRKQTALDALAELQKTNYRVNGQDALPGSAVYEYGNDRFYYGDSDYNPRSEPVYVPERHAHQDGILDNYTKRQRFEDDSLESRPLRHMNSKNTTLTIPDSDVRDRRTTRQLPEQRLPPSEAFMSRGFEPPRSELYSSAGAARYVNSTPYRELDADRQMHATYDPSANVAVAAAVNPSGKHTVVEKDPVVTLSDAPNLVGIGSDEHTGRINIGTEINNTDYGTSTGASTEQPVMVPVDGINAANARNPQAPVVKEDPSKQTPAKVAFPKIDKVNFVRGPSAVM